MTAADGICRRPFPEPTSLANDKVLAEDSYITAIDDDVFVHTATNDVEETTPVKWTMIQLDYNVDETTTIPKVDLLTEANQSAFRRINTPTSL